MVSFSFSTPNNYITRLVIPYLVISLITIGRRVVYSVDKNDLASSVRLRLQLDVAVAREVLG